MSVLAKDLRDSILQSAVQGKLTKQNFEDNSVFLLVKSAKNNLNETSLIDGRRVKEKKVLEIEKDYLELPKNWTTVRLGEVCIIARGGSPRPIKSYLTDSADGINWIKIGDTEKDGKYIYKTAEKIIPDGIKKSRFVHEGDFLLTNSMSFGRPYILKTDGCIHDGWLVISQPTTVFNQDYLYYLLSSPLAFKQFTESVSGAVVKNLNSDKVANAIFPVPPIEEQERIVAKVDELMAKIDEYEVLENQLEKIKREFPENMKVSILQASMEGNISFQNEEDSNVDKLLKDKSIKFTDDNECPNGWCVTTIDNTFDVIMGQSPNGDSLTDSAKDGLEFHQGKLAFGKKYINNSNVYTTSPTKVIGPNTLLLCVRAPIGTINITDHEICIGRGLCGIKSSHGMSINFMNYLFEWLKPKFVEQGTGSTFKAITAKVVKGQHIPIPPIEEQQRIVEKLDQLFPLVDSLVEK